MSQALDQVKTLVRSMTLPELGEFVLAFEISLNIGELVEVVKDAPALSNGNPCSESGNFTLTPSKPSAANWTLHIHPNKKFIQSIKLLRTVTQMGLKEAKNVIDDTFASGHHVVIDNMSDTQRDVFLSEAAILGLPVSTFHP